MTITEEEYRKFYAPEEQKSERSEHGSYLQDFFNASLVEQFKRCSEEKPSEPFSSSEHPEQWASIAVWQDNYIRWLEAKLEALEIERIKK